MTDHTETALTTPFDFRNREFRDAFQRGDADRMVDLLAKHAGSPTQHIGIVHELARLAIALRRQSVAVLGNHEAFVVRTPDGALSQVVRPVRLSLSDGSLYQLPEWDHDSRKMVVKNPHQAIVTFEGLQKINGVAGVAIQMPSQIQVDGAWQTNPHREIGEHGKLDRVVVAVNLVGPAPATGNPVAVQYVLDVAPEKDLVAMLLKLAKDNSYKQHVRLIDLVSWEAWSEANPDERSGWTWVRVHGHIGVMFDIGHWKIVDTLLKYTKMVQDSVKKAQTVCLRNALWRHPATAFRTVRIDERGEAVVPVVGWTNQRGQEAFARVLQALDSSSEVRLEEIVGTDGKVVKVEHVYDPGEDDLHEDPELSAEPPPDAEAPPVDERHRLIQDIDAAIARMRPAEVEDLGYEPETAPIEDLHAIHAAVCGGDA